MPVLPGVKSPDYIRFSTKKFDWMDEFVGAVVDHVKKRNPDLSVEFNHASAVASGTGCGSGEGIAKLIDYSGGDLYGNTGGGHIVGLLLLDTTGQRDSQRGGQSHSENSIMIHIQ